MNQTLKDGITLTRLKLPTLVFASWACYEVHFVIKQVFSDVTLINPSVVSALGIVFGLPALAAAMLRWRRGGKFIVEKENKDD